MGKKKRVDDVARYSIQSLGLGGHGYVGLHGLLSPNHATTPSPSASSRFGGGMSRTLSQSQNRSVPRVCTTHDSALGYGDLSSLDSLRIRQTNEHTMSYIAYMDGAMNRAVELKEEEEKSPTPPLADVPHFDIAIDKALSLEPFADDANDTYNNDASKSKKTNEANQLKDPMEEQESQECKEESSESTETATKSKKRRTARLSEIASNKISVARFRGIMASSNKEYDVEEIIGDLKDDNGDIPLDQIAWYSKTLRTLRSQESFDDEKE